MKPVQPSRVVGRNSPLPPGTPFPRLPETAGETGNRGIGVVGDPGEPRREAP